jgi:hypothetical protein
LRNGAQHRNAVKSQLQMMVGRARTRSSLTWHSGCPVESLKLPEIFDDEETKMSVTEATLRHWIDRVRAEYVEMPGLALTRWQMRRLWRFDGFICDAVVEALVTSGFLRERPDRALVRVAEYV